MESMLEAMAEYYSINLSEEVKKGMTEKAYRGEPQTSPPFGYDMRDKKFIINEREAKVVKMIFNDFASGAGYFNIAHKVNDMGVRTHRGNLFENRTVEYILRNPVYIGHIRWNPKEKTKRNYNHPDIITVKGNHEPIISNELFVKCQKRVEEIKKLYRPYYKPNTNPSHWLIGLCKCADCGGAVIKSGSQFQCNNYVHGKCFSHSVSTKKIEKFVLQNMNDLINTSDYSAFNISNISSKRINDDKYLYEVYDLEKRLERCKIAYQEGIDSLSEYKSNKSVITAELERVKKKIDLNNKVDDTPDYETLVHNLKITYDILTDENKTMQEKYKSSHEIISKVIVSKGNIDIEYFV